MISTLKNTMNVKEQPTNNSLTTMQAPPSVNQPLTHQMNIQTDGSHEVSTITKPSPVLQASDVSVRGDQTNEKANLAENVDSPSTVSKLSATEDQEKKFESEDDENIKEDNLSNQSCEDQSCEDSHVFTECKDESCDISLAVNPDLLSSSDESSFSSYDEDLKISRQRPVTRLIDRVSETSKKRSRKQMNYCELNDAEYDSGNESKLQLNRRLSKTNADDSDYDDERYYLESAMKNKKGRKRKNDSDYEDKSDDSTKIKKKSGKLKKRSSTSSKSTSKSKRGRPKKYMTSSKPATSHNYILNRFISSQQPPIEDPNETKDEKGSIRKSGRQKKQLNYSELNESELGCLFDVEEPSTKLSGSLNYNEGFDFNKEEINKDFKYDLSNENRVDRFVKKRGRPRKTTSPISPDNLLNESHAVEVDVKNSQISNQFQHQFIVENNPNQPAPGVELVQNLPFDPSQAMLYSNVVQHNNPQLSHGEF